MRKDGLDFPSKYPCPVCGGLQNIALTKKEKPYFQCQGCGVQVFIRGKWGIFLLSEINNNPDLAAKIKSLEIFDSCKLMQFRQRISLIKEEIAEIKSGKFLGEVSDDNKRRKIELISKLKSLEREYQDLLLADEKSLSNVEAEV